MAKVGEIRMLMLRGQGGQVELCLRLLTTLDHIRYG